MPVLLVFDLQSQIMFFAGFMVRPHQFLQLLVPLLLVFVLVDGAEEQVHHQNQPRDHDGDEEDRVILGLVLHVVDEGDQQYAAVDDLCEQHHFEDYEVGELSPFVAAEGVAEVGEEQGNTVNCASFAVHVLALERRVVAVAPEGIKDEDALQDHQRPRNHELDLRLEKDNLPSVLFHEAHDGDEY